MKKTIYNYTKKIITGIFVFQIILGGSIASILSAPQKTEAAEECTISATNIRQEIIPVGATYLRNNPPTLRATFRTKNCEGKNLSFELWEKDLPLTAGAAGLIVGFFSFGTAGAAATAAVAAFWEESNVVATTTHTVENKLSRIVIDYKLGEKECEFNAILGMKDCELFLRVLDGDKTIAQTPGYTNNAAYDCDPGIGLCSDDFLFSVISKTETDLGGAGLSDLNEVPPECKDENGKMKPGCYKLLEPIGGFIDPVFDAETQGIGGYVNTIIRLLLAVATLLAVLMIVVGGVQYMTTDAYGQKTEGISKMTNAVLGLILAFAVYIILNTINPNILNLDPGIKSVTLTKDEEGFKLTDVSTAQSGSYKLKGTYENPQPSNGVTTFVNYIKNDGYVLQKITVNTQQRKASFLATKGSSGKQVTIPINIGLSGSSNSGQAVSGDNKTPKGTTSIIVDRNPFISTGIDKPIFTRDGKTNLGAAFINIGATVNGANRGIGFHGHADNTMGETNGCVRMYNDDLLVLGPYMGKNGMQVIIQ